MVIIRYKIGNNFFYVSHKVIGAGQYLFQGLKVVLLHTVRQTYWPCI